MSVVTEKVVEKGLELIGTAASALTSEAPKLLSEYINYLIFSECITLFRNALWMFLAYFACKVLTTWTKSEKERLAEAEEANSKAEVGKVWEAHSHVSAIKNNITQLTAMKHLVMVGSVVVLSLYSMSSFRSIGKIIIAPRVYLIQEGAALFKGNPSPSETK